MGKFSALGFTLVELMVAVSIMSIVGIVAVANFGSFGENQKLKSASLDIQNFIKLASSNASSNVLCNNLTDAIWKISITSNTNFDLLCEAGGVEQPVVKSLSLANTAINISNITVGSCSTITYPIKVNFTPLISQTTFTEGGLLAACQNSSNFVVTLQNTKIAGSSASVTINKGGSVEVK